MVIDYLINQAYLDPTLGCPLYHAVHYRNTRGVELLLKASNKFEYVTMHNLYVCMYVRTYN